MRSYGASCAERKRERVTGAGCRIAAISTVNGSAMSEQFQEGDVVRLKSGGPTMTVTQVGEAHMTGRMTVWCVWFDPKGQQNGTFPPGALEKDE